MFSNRCDEFLNFYFENKTNSGLFQTMFAILDDLLFFAHPTADQRLMSAIKSWSAPGAWSRLRWNDLSFMQQDIAISQPADIYTKQQVPWLRGQCPVWITIFPLFHEEIT